MNKADLHPPLVSIIVPNYNHARYLPQRIESILDQTIQDFELILLDDCSTDKSVDILRRYADHPRVAQLVINDANTGSPFQQWEKGIGMARGKYIWIAESDDWCEPQFLKTLVPALEREPDCMVAFCQSYCLNDAGEILWQSCFHKLEDYLDGRQYIERIFSERNPIFNASMAIFRRARYLEISREFVEYKFCGDWLFWVKLLENGTVFISAKLLNYFRKHSLDVSGKAYASGVNWIEQTNILRYLFDKKLIDHARFRQMLKAFYSSYRHKRLGYSVDACQAIERNFKDVAAETGLRSALVATAVRASIRQTLNRLKGIA